MRISDIVARVKGDFVMESKMGITKDATKAMKWGCWEIVREFVQNALDASGMADVQRLDDGIMISDKGGGFNAKSFLIGISSKNKECDRGQFGNGMKFAIATALSLGMRVYIHSIDLFYIPEERPVKYPGVRGTEEVVEEIFVKIYKAKEEINGTNVYLQGYPESEPLYRERFIFRDGNDAYVSLFNIKYDRTSTCKRKVIFYDEILEPKEGVSNAIFVRDIFVVDENGFGEGLLFSYNLTDVELDVSRNIPRAFDVKWEIGGLWGRAPKEAIKKLLKALEDTKSSKENILEWKANYRIWNETAWKDALKEFYGLKEDAEGKLKATFCSVTEELTLVRYYAPDVPILELPSALASSLIGVNIIYSPLEIVRKRKYGQVEIISDKDLDRVERRVLNFLRRIHIEFCDYLLDPANIGSPLIDAYSSLIRTESRKDATNILLEHVKEARHVRIKVFKPKIGFEDTLGLYSPKEGYMAFRRDLFRNLPLLLETYTHELVHALGDYNEPVEDTPEGADFVKFQVSLLALLSKMIMEKHYKWLREFRVTE